jgi:uncharacterized membrane protein
MQKNRLEAFSDGVLAIAITIMVLELKPPHGADFAALYSQRNVFLSYVLSFVYVGIYWNNHHHMLHVARKVNGKVLWANLHLLFWLSLVPFGTAWLGENQFAKFPAAVYGVMLLAAGIAYYILQTAIIGADGPDSHLAKAIGADFKGKTSLVLYVVAIGCSFWNQWVSMSIYTLVAAIWLIPDSRIESRLKSTVSSDSD